MLLLQLEIPLDTVEEAVLLARRHGVITMLDPAPAPDRLPPALYRADVLCPNESEAESLTGIAVNDLVGAEEAARASGSAGARHAIVTLGARGAMVCDEQDVCTHVPNFRVTTTDTTAAGDALAAAVGVALAEGRPLHEAVRFGCAAGAMATTRRGAQEAMPTAGKSNGSSGRNKGTDGVRSQALRRGIRAMSGRGGPRHHDPATNPPAQGGHAAIVAGRFGHVEPIAADRRRRWPGFSRTSPAVRDGCWALDTDHLVAADRS